MPDDSRDLAPVLRRPLMLVPSDDEAFRRAAAFAVELYDITEPDPLDPPGRRPINDAALVAAAQAMLRGAYPRATIVALPKAPSGLGATWLVSRDSGRLVGPASADVVRSEQRRAGGSRPDTLAGDRASDDGMPETFEGR
jgi:hypothetical protein